MGAQSIIIVEGREIVGGLRIGVSQKGGVTTIPSGKPSVTLGAPSFMVDELVDGGVVVVCRGSV